MSAEPFVGVMKAQEGEQSRRFPGAVAAEQGEDLALAHAKRHTVENLLASAVDGQVLRGQHGLFRLAIHSCLITGSSNHGCACLWLCL